MPGGEMEKSLRQQTISGMLWTSVGKFGTMVVSFLANLILARLLTPSDFGCVGMLAIFIAISQTFIEGGFGAALIQKKNATYIDYTSIFYWNLLMSILFVIGIYFLAPTIARFYSIPLLESVLRVQSVILIINSFSIIPTNILIKQLDFKILNIRNVIASLCGVSVAIVLAFNDYGVWSLVFNSLVTGFVSVFLLWTLTSWRPSWAFNWGSIKELFNFGGLILLSNLTETVYTNIQGLIIGRIFSARDLGLYTQARKVEEIPNTSLSSIVNTVTFPVFSKLQESEEKLKYGVRKSVRSITFLSIPMMVVLIIIARPLFIFLFTTKWIEAVPYFQILCVFGILWTVNTINTNLFKAMGKGKIYFRVQLVKRVIGLIFILIGVRFGMIGMLWGFALTGYICFFINAFVAGKLIQYGIWLQIKDIGQNLILSILAGLVTCFVFNLFTLPLIVGELFLQLVFYGFLYMVGALIFKLDGFLVFKEVIADKLKK